MLSVVLPVSWWDILHNMFHFWVKKHVFVRKIFRIFQVSYLLSWQNYNAYRCHPKPVCFYQQEICHGLVHFGWKSCILTKKLWQFLNCLFLWFQWTQTESSSSQCISIIQNGCFHDWVHIRWKTWLFPRKIYIL